MSKNNNVKPDHFKTAGREPLGQDVVHEVERQAYEAAKAREKRDTPRIAVKDGQKPKSDQREGHLKVPGKEDK